MARKRSDQRRCPEPTFGEAMDQGRDLVQLLSSIGNLCPEHAGLVLAAALARTLMSFPSIDDQDRAFERMCEAVSECLQMERDLLQLRREGPTPTSVGDMAPEGEA